MSLDQRTLAAAQISAAVACNALAALRLAVTEATKAGLSPEEIEEVITLAREIQQQPISHLSHLAEQLLREPKKPAHVHSDHCGCGNHHG